MHTKENPFAKYHKKQKAKKGTLAFRNKFSKALIHERKQRKLNQKQLSEILGISITTISNCENRKSMPTENTLEKMREFFGEDFMA